MPVQTETPVKKTRISSRINRRLAVRFPCPAATVDSVSAVATLLFRRVRVHDVSQGGIALVLPRPLAPGVQLSIQVTNHILGFSYDLEVEVRHVTAIGQHQWLVGFAFPRKLSHAELASLL